MTWWTLRSMYLGPGYNSAALNCVTSAPDHLYVAFAPWMPMRQLITRRYRGIDRACGYWYIWDTPTIVEQQLPGDTDFHLFVLSELTPLTTYWGYMFAPDGPYGQEIQGPMFNFTTTGVEPGPEPLDAPILWNVPNRLLRCGNHYTYWAEDTWYAMVPTSFSIAVFRHVNGSMQRLDQANEPSPPAGVIQDADCRMSPDATTLHISYWVSVPAPALHDLRYATFDLTTNTWALHERICQPARMFLPTGETSLTLDADAKPHVLYTSHPTSVPQFDYRNRITGLWSPPEVALQRMFRPMIYCSASHDPATNHFHAFCTSNVAINYLNRRSPAGVWAGRSELAVPGCNNPFNSVASGVELPHYAQINPLNSVNHHEGLPPEVFQQNLSAPISRCANMISGPLPAAEIAIIFCDLLRDTYHLYRPPGSPWNPQVQLIPTDVQILTATYNHPAVISMLWEAPPPINTGLFAFYAPWH